MNKLLLISFLVLILASFTLKTFAVDWVQLKTPLDKIVELDIDSITEYKKYYFYNIKMAGAENVLTIQSDSSSPFSKCIKVQPLKEYNGDYSKITQNMTDSLEAVTYVSVVNTCYKRVKRIIQTKKAYSEISPVVD